MSASERLTKADHAELLRVVKLREQVAKREVEQRKAELLADFEEKLAATYEFDDAAWAEVNQAALEAVSRANEEIKAQCRRLGIPVKWGPSLRLNWSERGENAAKDRRDELRRVAVTRLDAIGKRAAVAIERQSVEIQSGLADAYLESDQARELLASMPSPSQLMPPLELDDIERRALAAPQEERRRGYGYHPTWTPRMIGQEDDPADE